MDNGEQCDACSFPAFNGNMEQKGSTGMRTAGLFNVPELYDHPINTGIVRSALQK